MALSQSDQMKIINAGFIIIRKDYENLLIKHKTKGVLHWRTYRSGFTSKAALDREMKDLLANQKIITT